MKKAVIFAIAAFMLGAVLAVSASADTWTQDANGTYWFNGNAFGTADGLLSNTNWKKPTPEPSQLWISRKQVAVEQWEWTYYVYDTIENSTNSASLLTYNAGLACNDGNYNISSAQIWDGSLWKNIDPSVNGEIGDEMITWTAAPGQIQNGSYTRFSFTTNLTGWIGGADFDISDAAQGTAGREAGWDSTVAPSTVPEPCSILAASAMLAPFGVMFRRRTL